MLLKVKKKKVFNNSLNENLNNSIIWAFIRRIQL